MNEYEYAPKPQKKKEKFLLGGLLLLAALLFAASEYREIPAPWAFQFLSVVALIGVVMLVSRSLLRNYSYAVLPRENAPEDTPPDFVVTEFYSRRATVVCRVALDEITDFCPVTRENRRSLAQKTKGKRVYRYTAELFPESLWLAELSGEEGTVYLYLLADERLASMLTSR